MSQNANPAILLIGKTGAGKSSLANRLYNLATDDTTEVFKVGHDMESETTEATSRSIMLGGKMYELIDMPGYMETSGSDVQTVNEITRIITKCPNGIKAILFVTEHGRMTVEERNAVRWLKRHFGPDVFSNVIVVISRVSKKQTLDRGLLSKTLMMQETDQTRNPLKELIQEAQGRWVISPNPEIFDSPDDIYWRREADLLIQYILSIGEPYTNDYFRRYREEMENEERERSRLEGVDKVNMKEIEQEIIRLQLLAIEDAPRRIEHLSAVRECEKRIADIKQAAEDQKQKSKTKLDFYEIATGLATTANAVTNVTSLSLQTTAKDIKKSIVTIFS